MPACGPAGHDEGPNFKEPPSTPGPAGHGTGPSCQRQWGHAAETRTQRRDWRDMGRACRAPHARLRLLQAMPSIDPLVFFLKRAIATVRVATEQPA